MDRFLRFDPEGIIVESREFRLELIQCFDGDLFDYILSFSFVQLRIFFFDGCNWLWRLGWVIFGALAIFVFTENEDEEGDNQSY